MALDMGILTGQDIDIRHEKRYFSGMGSFHRLKVDLTADTYRY